MSFYGLVDGTEASLKKYLGSLSGVDQVGADARAAMLATRSIKTTSKRWAIDTAITMVDLTTLEGADTPGKVKANVKWPNDILVNEKKISGLIAEVVDDGVVIGIGINVGMTAEELPVLTATSLAIEGVSDTNKNEILARVLALFESNFTTWDNGDNSVAQIYAALSSTLGTKVQIHYPNEQIEKGLAVAISPRGELILDSGSHVQAGDVVHLR